MVRIDLPDFWEYVFHLVAMASEAMKAVEDTMGDELWALGEDYAYRDCLRYMGFSKEDIYTLICRYRDGNLDPRRLSSMVAVVHHDW